MYIYIYQYTHIYIYIHIYLHIRQLYSFELRPASFCQLTGVRLGFLRWPVWKLLGRLAAPPLGGTGGRGPRRTIGNE